MSDLPIACLRASDGWIALGPIPSGASQVAQLADWGANLVLSMTPTDEMQALGAGDLAAALGRCRIDWLHLPIADFGAPGAQTAAAWPLASATARGVLAAGGRVFVHCRAGCGRSGMAVLRLLVELGEDSDAALARLRAVRPCAVETEGQLEWARSAAGKQGA